MNNSQGLSTNHQAHLRENKRFFFEGDFNKWKAFPVNQVGGLQSGIRYIYRMHLYV